MKKLFLLFTVLVLTASVMAEVYPTKFMEIPIDGTKREMIKQLEDKGFMYNEEKDWLVGEFNGQEAILSIVTKNRKVYGIRVSYRYFYTAREVIIDYNNLLKQFEENSNYIPISLNQEPIPEDEDIAYEMSNNKKYQAAYLQITHKADSAIVLNDSFQECTKKHLSLLSNEQLEDETYFEEIAKKIGSICWYEELKMLYINNNVWVTIDKAFGEKYILNIIYINANNNLEQESDL